MPIVLVIATLACAATSMEGWVPRAELPAEAPRSTPVGGSDGLAVTVRTDPTDLLALPALAVPIRVAYACP